MPGSLLNCAAGACCAPGSPEQMAAAVKLLCRHGCPDDVAGPLAKSLHAAGIVLFKASLAAGLGDFVLDRQAAADSTDDNQGGAA